MRPDCTRVCLWCSTSFQVDKPSRKNKYCSRSCADTAKYERSISVAHIAKRFWSKVDTSGGDDACWPFIGAKHVWGYGKFSWHYNVMDSHRVAFMLANGGIPDGAVIRHTCDNPPCCNPSHLVIGTFKDNSQDAVSRGRMHQGERSGPARLTEEIVREARRLYIPGHPVYGQRGLASRYGVTQSTMHRVLTGKSWRHVT